MEYVECAYLINNFPVGTPHFPDVNTHVFYGLYTSLLY